jgi:hypothetical protein
LALSVITFQMELHHHVDRFSWLTGLALALLELARQAPNETTFRWRASEPSQNSLIGTMALSSRDSGNSDGDTDRAGNYRCCNVARQEPDSRWRAVTAWQPSSEMRHEGPYRMRASTPIPDRPVAQARGFLDHARL